MKEGKKWLAGFWIAFFAVFLFNGLPAFAHEGHSHGEIKKAVLNINTASSGEIGSIVNAIAKIDLCHEITHYREVHNGFKKIDELKKVKGITEKLYQEIIDKVTIEI